MQEEKNERGMTGMLGRGAVVGAFFLCLWLPLADMHFGWFPKYANTENRTLAKRPELTWSGLAGFPKAFDTYFSDHFGLRNVFVRLDSLLKVKWFKTSPSSRVLVGKDGWLYYTAQDIITDYRCVSRFPQEYLEHVHKTIEERREKLRQMGIGYLIVVVPEKSTIYPEHLPDTVRKVGPQSKCDQAMEYLLPRTDVPIIDLREALLAAKGPLPLYYKTDSHWTNYGGLLGCLAMGKGLADLFPGVRPLDVSDFTVSSRICRRGGRDLAGMISRPDLFKEFDVQVAPRPGMTGSPVKVRKMVLFNDSYIDGMDPFLGCWFETVVHNRFKSFDMAAVEKEKPDIVIEEIAERGLSFRF